MAPAGVDVLTHGFGCRLVRQMTEAHRTIPTELEYQLIAKATERISDHATNIVESVVYASKGRDVRDVPFDRLEDEMLAG